MTNLDMRTHLSWVERIHDNLEQKLSSSTSGGSSTYSCYLSNTAFLTLSSSPGTVARTK